MMEAESADSLLSLSLQPGKSPVLSEGKDDTSAKACCKSKKGKPVPCVCVPTSPPSTSPPIAAVQALAALPASAVPVQAITVNSGMIRQPTPAPTAAAVVTPSPTSSCCPCPPPRSSNKSAGSKRAARSVSPSLSDDDVDMDSSVSANGEETNKKRKRKASVGVVGGGDEAIMQRRKKHNEVEVRRRKRMNETFTQLRTLVDCKSTNKIAILSAAISKIQHFNDLQSRMGAAWPGGPIPALPVKKESAKGSKNAVKIEKADLPFVLPSKSHATAVDKSSEKPLPALNPVAATPINPPHPALPNGAPTAASAQQANPLAQSLPGGVPPSLLPFSWAALHNPAVYAALHGGLGLGMPPDYTNRMLSPGLTELLSSETFSKLGLLPGYPMASGLGGLHSLLHNANAAAADPSNPKPAADPLAALYAASAFQIPPPPSALPAATVSAASAPSTASEPVPAITVKSENSTTPSASSSDRVVLSPAPATQSQSAESSASVPLPDVHVKLSSSSCTLCFTNAIDTVLLPCGHMKYCSACIKSLGSALKGCAECKAPVSRMQALLPADPNSKLSLTSKCVLCDENPADVAFSPCGHFCYCASCTGRAKKCPKCMSSIDTRLRIQQ